MSNSNVNESQWGNNPSNPQRGPSFEDPSHQASPDVRSTASEHNWDQAWGMADDSPPAGETHPGDAYANWDATGNRQPHPIRGAGYGSAPQAAPYQGDPGPQGGSWGDQPSPGSNPYAQPYRDQNPYGGQAAGYQQPYGSYDGYGYSQPVRSKTTAALLAFFLGGLGVHDFYLGKKNLGFIHLGLAVGAFLIMMVGGIVAATSGDPDSPLFALIILGYLVALANGIWAFVEFVIILVKPEYELGR